MRSENVAIFWDYENCTPAAHLTGYNVVERIRSVVRKFGTNVKLFKAYLELSNASVNVSSKSVALRSELQSSGVSLTDCPHNGGKDVVDKMILVDMLLYAMDNPAPSNIVLITGDRDFAYAVSTLRNRGYTIVVIAQERIVHPSIKANASAYLDWSAEVLDAKVLGDHSRAASMEEGSKRHRNGLFAQTSRCEEKLAAGPSDYRSPGPERIPVDDDSGRKCEYPSTPSRPAVTRNGQLRSLSPTKSGPVPLPSSADDVFVTTAATGARASPWSAITQRAVCSYFLHGRCLFGDRCKKAHQQTSYEKNYDASAGKEGFQNIDITGHHLQHDRPRPLSSSSAYAPATSPMPSSPDSASGLVAQRQGDRIGHTTDETEESTSKQVPASVEDDIIGTVEHSADQDIDLPSAPGVTTATARPSEAQDPLIVVPTEHLGLKVVPPIFAVLVRRLQFHKSNGWTSGKPYMLKMIRLRQTTEVKTFELVVGHLDVYLVHLAYCRTDARNPPQELAKSRYDTLLCTTPELLISGSDDRTLFLWSPFGPSASRKPVARLLGHQRQVSYVAFSPDGRWAASAGWDGSVEVWEGRMGNFVATLRGHEGAVYRLAWSAESRLLVSASKDSTLEI
ncbi:putative NYN domain containing protein [Lyophyllum shimeji]|uniref:NYN domain containing protein n=1 Tax=Lyophyllum shimeji TaxID=47721 RepID=A0A9P3PSP5_LYOSH|nr:putative NYN domain containing protein [Lyophyllum shimeji]